MRAGEGEEVKKEERKERRCTHAGYPSQRRLRIRCGGPPNFHPPVVILRLPLFSSSIQHRCRPFVIFIFFLCVFCATSLSTLFSSLHLSTSRLKKEITKKTRTEMNMMMHNLSSVHPRRVAANSTSIQ
jgi:hypothetical protein